VRCKIVILKNGHLGPGTIIVFSESSSFNQRPNF
jgi:hypothetical protein